MWAWVVSTGLFWTLAAIYLGGMPVRIEGKPASQLLGLIVSFGLYQAVFHGLAAALGGMGFIGMVVIPIAVATVAMPLITWLGFKVVGGGARFGGEAVH